MRWRLGRRERQEDGGWAVGSICYQYAVGAGCFLSRVLGVEVGCWMPDAERWMLGRAKQRC